MHVLPCFPYVGAIFFLLGMVVLISARSPNFGGGGCSPGGEILFLKNKNNEETFKHKIEIQ